MLIEEHDSHKHRGLEGSADFVLKKGSDSIRLTEGEAYLLCIDLLEYLSDE